MSALERERGDILNAIDRILGAESYVQVSEDDLTRFGGYPVYARVYNLRKTSDTFGEALDNVREALRLKDTHYLVIHNQVGDVVTFLSPRNMVRTAEFGGEWERTAFFVLKFLGTKIPTNLAEGCKA